MSISVIYHGGCADGMGSAFAVWYHVQKLKTKGAFIHARFFPGYYGTPIDEEAYKADKIYFVDFSLPRKDMIELMAKHDVTVIDHHDSAQKNLEGLNNCLFDMTQCGAMLTWKYFATQRGDTSIPEIFKYIQDRDLWKNELPNTNEINNVIFTLPIDATGEPESDKVHITFCKWANLMNDLELPSLRKAVIEKGEVLEQAQRKYIEAIKKIALLRAFRTIDGKQFELPIVNAHYTNISTILAELALESESGMSMSYYVDENGMYKYSLRCRVDCEYNLGQLVSQIQGDLVSTGGHPRSAGFVSRGAIHYNPEQPTEDAISFLHSLISLKKGLSLRH